MGKGPISSIVNLAIWLTGILVSLAVGFGMINKVLSLPTWLGGAVVAQAAGWIVVTLTLLSVILTLIDKIK